MWLFLVVAGLTVAAAESDRRTIEGLENPESALVGPDGRVYVSEIGGFEVDGDGRISVIDDGATNAKPFAEGLDDPKGLATYDDWIYVTDRDRIWRIDSSGETEVLVSADDFPQSPRFLNDLAVDDSGILYVSDTGLLDGGYGAIFRVDPDERTVETLLREADDERLISPNGLLTDGPHHLLVVDFSSGVLYRLDLNERSLTPVNDGFGGGDGLARDASGRLYVSDYRGGRVFVLDSVDAEPRILDDGFQAAADLGMGPTGRTVLVPDMEAGSLTFLPVPPQ